MCKLSKKILVSTLLIIIAAFIHINSAYAESNTELVDRTYVNIPGEVSFFVDKDKFRLKYWGGEILVDVNDGRPDLFNNNLEDNLNLGDKVVVSGIVDDHLMAEKEIDARQVSVIKGDNVTVYNGNVNTFKIQDNNFAELYSTYNAYKLGENSVRLSGYITEVPNEHQFVLNYGTAKMLVEISDLKLDKPALFTVGDFVVIEGRLDKDLFNSTSLIADNITKISYYQTVMK